MRPCLIAILLLAACQKAHDPYASWRIKGGTPDGLQFSSLTQINSANASQLRLAWRFRTGDADTINNRTQIQCNPIVIDGVLFGTTATLAAFALDASNGKELWRYKPDTVNESLGANRGLTYWSDGDDHRILYTFGEFLYALDAKTGKPVNAFGDHGRVSLKEGLGARSAKLMVLSNTPGVIYKDLIIEGSRVHEGPISAPGHIRAFNVRTGKLEWVFHTIPQPGEPGIETWPDSAWQKTGGANAWSGMTVDEKRGMVFAATGSASFDFYGGNRKGQNLFANCVLALDAATGKRKWHFQIVHHDLWDRDLPAAPVLVTVDHDGKKTDAVAQVTKSGYVYVFDRETGTPLFPVAEVQFPPSRLEGESAWPTQPIPVKPPPFTRQIYSEAMLNHLVSDTAEMKVKFRSHLSGGPFIPPSLEGTLIFPGLEGGAGWGGPSFDPRKGILYVCANEIPFLLTMVDVRLSESSWKGINLYRTHCATCHGIDRLGDGKTYPSIDRAGKKFNLDQLTSFIKKGKGMMPSFSHLDPKVVDAIGRYVLDLQDRSPEEMKGIFERQPDILYSNTGYTRFMTKDGYPAVTPPWCTLSAIDLNKGEIVWQIPLGEYPELKAKGIPATGAGSYGGLAGTAGDIIFVGATRDEKFRVVDKENGKILWEYSLPAAGYATPSVYQLNGKEFVVIACGGGKWGTKSGGDYLAFTLPDK